MCKQWRVSECLLQVITGGDAGTSGRVASPHAACISSAAFSHLPQTFICSKSKTQGSSQQRKRDPAFMTVSVNLSQSAVITLLEVKRAARHSLPWLDHPFYLGE